jgi:hypothetical protein
LSSSTLTLTGLPTVPVNTAFLKVDVVTVQGTIQTYSAKNYLFSLNAGTGVLTVSGASFLASDLGYRVFFVGTHRAFDSSTNSYSVTETDSIDQHLAWESLLNATASIGAGTNYLPSASGLSLQGYKSFVLSMNTAVNTTTTVEILLDPTLTDWVDITRSGDDLMTGTSGAANYIDCIAVLQWADLNAAFIRIKSVTVGGASTAQYDVRRRAL